MDTIKCHYRLMHSAISIFYFINFILITFLAKFRTTRTFIIILLNSIKSILLYIMCLLRAKRNS